MERVCQGLLDRLGAGFRAGETVANLSVAERQLVEIARALQAQSRVLVLDEPTTALSTRETDRLFAILRELRTGGLALIYISHRMAEVEMLADRVTVLRDGALVGVLERAAVDSGEIVRLMVGRDLNTLYPRTRPRDPRDAVVLEVRDLADRRRVHPCSLRVHAGEVLLGGAPLSGSDPQASIRAGLAYVTEDRAALGLFAAMSLSDNVNLSVIGADSRGPGILDRGRAAARSAAAIEDLQIRGARDVAAGALSGGNQQKVLLARCLQWRPKVLILDEPTRGIDIGAKAEIYRIIDALAATGVGILVISSELPEIIGIADRVLVMREGAIAGELSGSGLTQRAIIRLATGASGPRIH
jgi:ribose transport system ATP-binding protein